MDRGVGELRNALSEQSEYTIELTGPPREFDTRGAQLRDLVSVWEQSARTLLDICTVEGIPFVLCLQPNQYVEGSKPMGAEERAIAIAQDGKYLRRVREGYPRLRKAGSNLAQRGAHFHDLTELFLDVEEALYIDNCCHTNAAGNALMGEALVEALLSALP